MTSQRLPGHRYVFIQEIPFEEIRKYSFHYRFKYYQKGNHFCAKCGVECNRLIWGKTKSGVKHLDLYNTDLTVMLTLGHIVPKSRGGHKTLASNIRPLCHKCNQQEGNSFDHFFHDSSLFEAHLYEKWARRLSKNPFQDGSKTAQITRIFKSENDNKIYFGFAGGFTYPANRCRIVSEHYGKYGKIR